jgi:hypothetical protein
MKKTIFDDEATNLVVANIFHGWEACAILPMTEIINSVKVTMIPIV